MNCLFCKQNSDNSKSVEHIIPESLGNKEHILPKGFVCDNCNQYFASKVEKPLLEQPYFRDVRHRARIESKKGRVPIENAIIISPELVKAEIFFDQRENKTFFLIDDEMKAKRIFSSPKGAMINPGLDEIKKYARFGEGVKFWPYHQRRIYSEETRFNHPLISMKDYEVLHEFQILPTKDNHYYFVIAIMGIEYAFSLGGPGIDSYQEWLKENHYASILERPYEKRKVDKFGFQ